MPSPAFTRGVRILAVVAAAWLAAIDPPAALAQLRPIVIKDARVVTMDGTVLEKASIKIQGGKIEAIAPTIETGFFTKTINASGKTVTPGLIDVWGAVATALDGGTSPSPLNRVLDAVDRYAAESVKESLAGGVTAVFVSPPPAAGIAGMGSVLKVTPFGTVQDRVLVEEAGVCGAVGVVGDQSPIARVNAVVQLRDQFDKARDYREARELYDEDLKEYVKKLKERREKEGKEDSEDGEKDTEKEKDDEKAGTRGAGSLLGTIAPAAEEGGEGEGKGKEGKDDKKDELEKPQEPAKDPANELLLRVLDGELPLRIEAHRPEDILNVLELAKDYNVRLILVGASGGRLVAEAIAEADVPVVCGTTVRDMTFQNNAYRYHAADNAARLAEAGAEVHVSGAGDASLTRFLLLNAALAAQHGWEPESVLKTLTRDAAEFLGIGDRVGRLARGMEADLVIWSDDPLSPGARAEKVFVGGALVYDAEEQRRFVQK